MNKIQRTAKRFISGGAEERRLLRQKVLFRTMAKRTPLLGVTTPYGQFVLDSADRGQAESIFAFGAFEDSQVLREAVSTATKHGVLSNPSEKCFIDVGANIGTTVVPALNVMGFASALAIEPGPRNVALLRANMALNDLSERVRVLPAAVGAENGTTELWLGQENHSDHRLWHRTDLKLQKMSGSVTVKVTTLDDALADVPNAGLIWIDTQGYEGFVLAGASRVLGEGTPLVTEFWPGGMKGSGSWDRYREIVAGAAFLKDLRTGVEYTTVTEKLIDQLGSQYAGLSDYTDLMFWFPKQ
jgi:FkbM family methyltransferase